MFKVTKSFSFSMAHRLVDGYVGKCRSLHGHNYKVEVSIGSPSLDGYGFVVDFNELKYLKAWVDDYFDHTTLLNVRDPLVGFISEIPDNVVRVVDGNPTAELIAKMIYDKAVEMFSNGVFKLIVLGVTVWETETSSAEYSHVTN